MQRTQKPCKSKTVMQLKKRCESKRATTTRGNNPSTTHEACKQQHATKHERHAMQPPATNNMRSSAKCNMAKPNGGLNIFFSFHLTFARHLPLIGAPLALEDFPPKAIQFPTHRPLQLSSILPDNQKSNYTSALGAWNKVEKQCKPVSPRWSLWTWNAKWKMRTKCKTSNFIHFFFQEAFSSNDAIWSCLSRSCSASSWNTIKSCKQQPSATCFVPSTCESIAQAVTILTAVHFWSFLGFTQQTWKNPSQNKSESRRTCKFCINIL